MVPLVRAGVLGAAFALVAACNRTPPEPAPIASVAPEAIARAVGSATAMAAKTTGARCLTPLASSPPTVPPPAGSACPPDPHPDTKMPVAEVSFPEAPRGDGGPPLRIDVELAMKADDVERGLMFRREMGDNHGMLFKLEGRRDHTFWMHNTCIPLDMMFIDDDGVIVGIVEAAAPLTDTTRSVGCPSSFVLEVNGGWARKRGIAPGQKVALPSAVR
jgi:uncharacterized membrane protein (UPF0127 family)